ncbi:hypothetical protein BDL97_10G023600 [Sphagnum fallax]|uniref:Uncharacterized protein n=1 Tax=Sphagnum jensenii TaxID=128206 RepID=A0ABP0VQR6_9BRYO|nr:hypothetical protein BDL97_10G023600 [Sphagnum fallax]KAH8949268.1 hypothetical protein BDL97_10G023600 [Sphagnum fallax]
MVRGSSSNNNSSVPPPWRQPAPAKKKDKYEHLKMRATKEPGRGSTMYAPPVQKRGLPDLSEPASENMFDFDEDLQLAFQRNFQFLRRAFSFDTLLKPLPPQLGQSIARNLGFFTRIFTQFFDPKGIQNARQSIGLGQEEGRRRVK